MGKWDSHHGMGGAAMGIWRERASVLWQRMILSNMNGLGCGLWAMDCGLRATYCAVHRKYLGIAVSIVGEGAFTCGVTSGLEEARGKQETKRRGRCDGCLH